MLQATPQVWLRKKVASLSTALLPYERPWPCELPGGLVPCGQPLRRFCFATGEVFRFCNETGIEPALIASNAIALPIELFKAGRRCASPRRSGFFWNSECFTPSYAFDCGLLAIYQVFVEPAGPPTVLSWVTPSIAVSD